MFGPRVPRRVLPGGCRAGVYASVVRSVALSFALVLALGCRDEEGPPRGPSVTEQVAAELAARHGESFTVTFAGGGVNAGNLFDGPERTYEARLTPLGGGPVAHAAVRVRGGRVTSIEDDVPVVRAQAQLATEIRERMREALPELAAVCVRATYETDATASPTHPARTCGAYT